MLNLQGLKTVSGQKFSPCIPNGFRLIGVSGINCSKYFNPGDIRDNANLTLKCNTSISGASFVCDQGSEAKVVGPDGTLSERILYADTSECDEEGKGTPIFGTQKVNISGQVTVTLNLILMDNFGREVTFPVSANITIAPSASPLILTSFFEMCMPSVHNTAILPRFTELCNVSCETRLATNSYCRDLTINSNGEVCANLIIALCVACEKKIVVPVQLCVLSTGFVEVSARLLRYAQASRSSSLISCRKAMRKKTTTPAVQKIPAAHRAHRLRQTAVHRAVCRGLFRADPSMPADLQIIG